MAITAPVAFVTGASRGLGREIALALGRNGYLVIINYLSSDEEAHRVTREIGENARVIKGDIGDPKQAGKMAAMVEEEFGSLRAIINNAGITMDNLLVRQSEKEWDAVVRTNLKGSFNIIRRLAPIMIKSGGGHIVNVSSLSGVRGKAGQPAYSASKAALLGLTRAAAVELAGHNIRVNAVLPGYMMTEMGANARKALEKAKEESVTGRLSVPEDVAEFVVFLLKTGNITGQVFNLDSRII